MTRQLFKKILHVAVLAFIAAHALVLGQGSEALRVLGEMRAALGGDAKLAAVKSFMASGRSARTAGQFQLSSEFEMNCELPDKYVKTETISMGTAGTTNKVGFNGGTLIQETSSPASMAGHGGGGGVVMFRSAGGPAPSGPPPTPEQQATLDANRLRIVKAEFTRLTAAMFGASFGGNPVEFTHVGQAEAPEGKADILEIKGAQDFVARLFVDGRTRRPLMITWQGPGMAPVINMRSSSDGGSHASAADRDRTIDARMREMQAAAQRVVEHRMYFSDYREVDGVRLPHQIVRSVDGATVEEIAFEKFKLNERIDVKKFR
jgi:hypothetical protein